MMEEIQKKINAQLKFEEKASIEDSKKKKNTNIGNNLLNKGKNLFGGFFNKKKK